MATVSGTAGFSPTVKTPDRTALVSAYSPLQVCVCVCLLRHGILLLLSSSLLITFILDLSTPKSFLQQTVVRNEVDRNILLKLL